jgi:hypothetical protein
MEVICSSETSADFQRTTRRYIPEDTSTRHNYCCDNLNSYIDSPVVLEHVPLHQRQHMWFMQDVAPSHVLGIVSQHLNTSSLHDCPDPNPLDYCLWGHLKTSVYSAPSNDLEVLQQRAENACQEIERNQEFSTECAPLCDEELKVVLKCMGII